MIRLNIQRFADATQSITLTLRSQSYNPVRYVYFQVDQVGPQTFNWRIWNAKANSSSAAWITAHQFHFWINGQQVWDMSGISGYNSSGDYLGSSHHVFPVTISSEGVSGTYTSPNIPDGFNITAKAGYDSAGYVKESTVWFTCAKYNFTSQPSISVDSKDETSIKVKWSTSQTCNEIKWYRGSTLVATTNPNGTSGTYTFTGLTANTQYTLKGNFKRADSGYTMDSNTITPSTDNYPYVTTLNPQSITLGQTLTQTVNISNPHSRQTTVYVKLNNSSGTTIASATTSGTSASIAIPTNDLYQQIPSAQSGTLYYYCVYDNHTTTGITGTYRINGNEKPTFPTANWSYVANLTSLTNDNQIIIDGYSTINITIDTPASSDYYASILNYYATWGNATPVTFDEDETATLIGGNGTSLVVLANDSRGLQSALQASTLDISSKRVSYTKPIVNVSETHRLNGIDTLVTLNATGTMYKGTFGANGVQNAIASVGYRVKGVGQPDSAYSQLYPISLNNCSFDSSTGEWTISNASIHQNGQSGGFPTGSSYNVKLEFYDAQGLLGFGTYVSTVEDGTIARDVFKGSNGEYHEGINGLADDDYAQTIHGKINVTDGYYLNGEPFEGGGGGGDSVPIGLISPYPASTPPHGWLLCDGSAVSRTTYKELFEVIGTSHGSGDGSTTFNLPNMPGYTPVGVDANDSNLNTAGKKYGSKTVTLTVDQIPSHSHDVTVKAHWGNAGNTSSENYNIGTKTDTNWNNRSWMNYASNTGGGQAHNNMQPSIAEYYMIKAFKVSTPGNDLGDTLPIGSVIDYDGDTVPDGYEEVTGKMYEAETLWTNSSPSNAFSGQTINFNGTYSHYDVISWVDGITYETTRVYLNKRTIMQIMEGGYIRTRYATATSNSITFTGGTFYNSYASGTANNYQVIPFTIIGYKEV